MRLLLDTHTFLWFTLDDPLLSKHALALIVNPDNDILVSPISYWEIAIKISIGKYSLSEPVAQFFEREIAGNQFDILPIQPKHVGPLASLLFHHRDPFDRLLIAQAIVEQVPVISVDAAFDAYPVQRLW